MTIKSEIYARLSNDTSIAYYVGNNIYHDILPLNDDVSTYSLVYSSRVATPTHTIGDRDISDQYALTVKIVGTNPVKIELINDEVRRCLQTYTSSKIPDILFERSNDVYDDTNDLFTESLDFTVWYYN